MPKGDKYISLKQYLIHLNQPSIKLTFQEIEKSYKIHYLHPLISIQHGGQIIMTIRR